MGHLNDSGERLLGLCEGSPTGLLTVAGTFFHHKLYDTWMHAKTNQQHHIDHVLAPVRTMRLILDVKTMPGFGFETDHRMARVRVRVPARAWRSTSRGPLPTGRETRVPKLRLGNLTNSRVNTLNTELHACLSDGLLDD